MTIASACQSAAIRLVGRRPGAFFSASIQFELELLDLAQDVAVEIAKKHDWQVLTALKVITGDGAAESFALPADYDRMPVKAAIHSSRWTGSAFRQADSLDAWLFEKTYSTVGAPGWWLLLDGKMQFYPVLSDGETASFYYVSKNVFAGSNGTPKAVATADTDTFRLDERLLTLGLVWRWRQQKRLEYAEDLRTYEIALSEAIGRDRGQRLITVGRARNLDGIAGPYSGGF